MIKVTVKGVSSAFADLASARRYIREIAGECRSDITLECPAGLYSPTDFRFEVSDCPADGQLIIKGDEGAVIHGGITVTKEQWLDPDGEIAGRFAAEASEHIRMIDLRSFGLSYDDWGEMQAIGAYETSSMYDSRRSGSRCDVFCGSSRMHCARYPNEGFLRLSAVADVGDAAEFPEQNYFADWGNRRNQRGGAYIIDRETNAHISRWQDDSTAWMFGYFYHDWADSSTPIKINTANRLVYPEYVSRYGAKAGALYYLYNVPEELDCVGEYYLDRANGKLYFYPGEEDSSIDFCYSSDPLICMEGCRNITLSGFTLKCTMGDAVTVTGSGITLTGLNICNIGGNAIRAEGYRNTISGCEISHTGRGGILVSGGEKATLTHGENLVTENFIHDISEVYLTYQLGVSLGGVGNICSHNEICRSPHAAIGYGGNEHLIEYNYIHDVVLQSSDAGAIYAGYDWTAHGTVIRYNILRHIGDGAFRPDGIYWDDGFSGQTAYGNLLIDVRKNGFLAGGGRENVIENNVLISCATPIAYDDRNRDAFVHDGWARNAVKSPKARHWQNLHAVKRDSEPWKSKYPRLAAAITDFDRYDDIDFPCNPSYSSLRGNVIIDKEGRGCYIADSVRTYSEVQDFEIFRSCEEAGFDLTSGHFADGRIPDIPVDKIGRTGHRVEL